MFSPRTWATPMARQRRGRRSFVIVLLGCMAVGRYGPKCRDKKFRRAANIESGELDQNEVPNLVRHVEMCVVLPTDL